MTANYSQRRMARVFECLNLAIHECVKRHGSKFDTDLVGLAVQYSRGEIERDEFERFMAQRIDQLVFAFDIKAGEYKPKKASR